VAFTVRIFGHDGLSRMKVLGAGAGQLSTDSVFQLNQPYLWAQQLTTNGTAPVASSVAPTPTGKANDPTDILRIEVPDGQAIRYEVNPPNRSVAASVNSPILAGLNQIKFGASWTISIIDASGT
jgi:hypothetical protein